MGDGAGAAEGSEVAESDGDADESAAVASSEGDAEEEDVASALAVVVGSESLSSLLCAWMPESSSVLPSSSPANHIGRITPLSGSKEKVWLLWLLGSVSLAASMSDELFSKSSLAASSMQGCIVRGSASG